MKRSSTFILGSLLALSLAACRARDNGAADTRTGSADSTAMTRDTGSGMDSAMSGGAGTMSDSSRMRKDTTSR